MPSNQLADLFLPRVPRQNATYAFVPQDFLRGLFGVYGMDLPMNYTKFSLDGLDPNVIPSNIDRSTISYLGEFLSTPLVSFVSKPCTIAIWYDDGKGVGLDYRALQNDRGWMTIETVILKINTRYVKPGDHFPIYRRGPATLGSNATIGYDAAVCVLKYEPWIVEAYNTSAGSPSALRIIGKGDGSTSLSPSGHIRGPPIKNTRYLNATGKTDVNVLARGNSVYQIVSDAGMDLYYPTPMVGPIAPPRMTCLLILIYSAGRFFH